MNEPDPQSRTSLLPTPKYRWESQGPNKRSNATNQPVGKANGTSETEIREKRSHLTPGLPRKSCE
jgi:hypothetical protein